MPAQPFGDEEDEREHEDTPEIRTPGAHANSRGGGKEQREPAWKQHHDKRELPAMGGRVD